ncbi:MAG: hypothetical protein ISS31_10640 [Kiritimatiellae bacterium]|nr:hypothetical protein [Kiritimatiellia bacterium]
MTESKRKQFLPGITLLSVATILLGLIVLGFMIQVGNVHAGASFLIGGLFSLPLRPVMFIVPLILISGLVFHLTKKSIYTRAEMICILATLLLAPPIMTEGFWSYIVGGMVTIPQTSDMHKLDGYSDKMWPHGENIVEGALSRNGLEAARQEPRPPSTEREATHLEGEPPAEPYAKGTVGWDELEVDAGESETVPVLSNAGPEDVSTIRIPVPLFKQDKLHLNLNEPYLLTLLARAADLEAESYYYCRVFYDDEDHFATEVFSSREEGEPTYLRPGSFVRKGRYGVEFAAALEDTAFIELGLVGRGSVAFADLALSSVSAVDEIFDGRKVVTQAEYDALPPKLRGRVLVKPDSMFSLAGLKLVLSGGIPFKEWTNPAIFWFGFVGLLLAGTFAIAVIMRKQWIENERYPLPVAQIPIRLLGLDTTDEDELGTGKLPSIWTNRLMWTGFGVTLFWCIMKIWAAYNSSVPNLGINVPIGPYFSDPGWGGMWNVQFKVCSVFLALALFMELNVLLTIVLGFFLYRAQFWVGHSYGLTSTAGYPFNGDQMNGAYLTYALLVIFFTRKYLWLVIKRAIKGGTEPGEAREAMSYRTCLIALVLCYAGIAVWAHWAGIGVAGMLVFYTIMLLIALVAAKLRAECGVPFSTYFPWSVMTIVPLLGGAPLFGPGGFIFIAMVTEIFVIRSFLLLPGLQVEMIELGRRARVVPSHLVTVALLGVLGSLLVGGWFVLSNAYAEGATKGGMGSASMGLKTHWFRTYGSYTKAADQEAAPQEPTTEEATAKQSGGIKPQVWAVAYGAGTVALATILRQFFAGFWFHPIGFLVGGTWMAQEAWGSILLAWLIRFTVLKLGGAATVRNKLMPFATGIFLGGMTAYFIYVVTVSYLKFFVPGTKSVWWSIWAL